MAGASNADLLAGYALMISKGRLAGPCRTVSRSGKSGWGASSRRALGAAPVPKEAGYTRSKGAALDGAVVELGTAIELPCSQLFRGLLE